MAPGDLFNNFQKKKKNWIAGVVKHPGALHRQMGIKAGTKIPAGKLAAAAKKGGVEGKRARLAETFKSFHHKKKKTLRSADAVVKSEQNASHQFTKKHKKHKVAINPNAPQNYGPQMKRGYENTYGKIPSGTPKVNIGPAQPWRTTSGQVLKKSKHYKHNDNDADDMKKKKSTKKKVMCKKAHKHIAACK